MQRPMEVIKMDSSSLTMFLPMNLNMSEQEYEENIGR